MFPGWECTRWCASCIDQDQRSTGVTNSWIKDERTEEEKTHSDTVSNVQVIIRVTIGWWRLFWWFYKTMHLVNELKKVIPPLCCSTYILLDGLSYNMRGYFASCVVFFRGARKNASNEQNVREYYNYVKPSN